MKRLIGRVSEDTEYAPHGLRVTGYKTAKRCSGEDVATAHGLWRPGSSSRYDRFDLLRDIIPLSAAMVDTWLFTRYMLIGLYVGFATVGGWIATPQSPPSKPHASLLHASSQ